MAKKNTLDVGMSGMVSSIEEENKPQDIYTTERINQIIEQSEMGYTVDYTPFYKSDTSFRSAYLNFQLTEWEEHEWLKCFNDPIYFIETYCKFQTDYGITTVRLYDFQREIIKAITDTDYNVETDLFIPTNPNIILMASRQISKCVEANTKIQVRIDGKEKKISIYDLYKSLYRMNNRRTSWKENMIVIMKECLYKIYRIL